MLEEPVAEKKKKSGLRLVSRKSTKKMLGKWKKLDSTDKSDSESQGRETETFRRHVLGLPLSSAIQMDPSLDGISLPSFFRIAIDYVEAHGLHQEGIYRVSSPKSRLDELERLANECSPLRFLDAHEAAGLIKRFLRQLPEPLVPPEFERLAERCECDWKGACTCGMSARIKEGLKLLDESRYQLLAYVFIHAQRVINMEHENKMGIPALGLLLQTVLDMSRKLVCLFVMNASSLLAKQTEGTSYMFEDFKIKPYILPRSPTEVEEWDCGDKPLIEEELAKQNNLLSHLHRQLCESLGDAPHLEEQLWGVQTAITALKRRLKAVAEPTPPSNSTVAQEPPCTEMYEEKQLMAVHSMLKEDVSEEQRRIAELCWKLRDASDPLMEGGAEKAEVAIEWRERCELEEAARAALIEEIGRLRTDCAVLRAKIEMNKAQVVSTRF